jgi:hypothetical protein
MRNYNTFLPVFYATHKGVSVPDYPDFERVENAWMNIFGLGKFETYQFLYSECRDITHFQQWMIDLKGEEFLNQAAVLFNDWQAGALNKTDVTYSLLTPSQLQHWEEQGYLKISGLVEDILCDHVKDLISSYFPDSWYHPHPDWHGLMLQVYQHPAMEAIRRHPVIFQLFAELYKTTQLVAGIEKLSFNPPETASWKFQGADLHWDIDFHKPHEYHIQGLMYVDDVPADRGPLLVVPGFHHQYPDFIQSFTSLDDAIVAMRKIVTPVPVTGRKGDVIVWRHTLPHAASANHSALPRFVQYLNFQ